MQREQQQDAEHERKKEVPIEAEAVAESKASFKSGAAPAVADFTEQERKPTASERAFQDEQTKPAVEGEKEKKAAADTQKVLQYIKEQAKAKTKESKQIEQDSMLHQRLSSHYLKDYLASPSPEAGKGAVDKIGEQLDPAKADQNDYWESTASAWNSHKVPDSVQLLLPGAPTEMGAATAVLGKENREHMPYIDAPQMIGNPNTDTGKDADVYGGGKNVSQLMHWATGVKHSAADPGAMRDLFLAYEMYHLEGWDAFGEDSINDMISEEAGRIMGRQLQGGEINQANFGSKLNEGFNESRAWVGSLLKERQGQLDNVITSKTVVESSMWYGEIPDKVQWWGDSTIYLDLLNGKSIEEVQADSRTQHFIEVYSLIYHSQEWQKEHGKIKHSNFTQSMLEGRYDKAFEKSVKGQELTDREKLDAYIDAKAPWVPGFARGQMLKNASVKKKLGGGGAQ